MEGFLVERISSPSQPFANSNCVKKSNPSKEQQLLPLVEEDNLFFRIVPPQRHRVCLAARKRSCSGVRALGKAFCQAFNQIWEQIPEADRQCMLDYWAQSMIGLSLPFRPLIQVVVDRYPLPLEARFKSLGTELNF
jgi:hypothetical protein